jgi:hypothetical protein
MQCIEELWLDGVLLAVEEDVLCVWIWMCCAGSMMAEAGVYPCAAVAVQLE